VRLRDPRTWEGRDLDSVDVVEALAFSPDDRFLYVEQSMWKRGDCTTHALLRMAVTSQNGIVAPAEVVAALGHDPLPGDLPGWVTAWIAADAERPWPPDM